MPKPKDWLSWCEAGGKHPAGSAVSTTTAGMPSVVPAVSSRNPTAPAVAQAAYSMPLGPYALHWQDDERMMTPATAAAIAFFDGIENLDDTPAGGEEYRVGVVESFRGKNPAGNRSHRYQPAGDDWRNIPAAEDFEIEYRHRQTRSERQRIAGCMEKAGYPKNRIERFLNCGAAARVVEHADTGEFKVKAFYCHDRWCEKCTQPKSLQTADNIVKKLDEAPTPGVSIVLTNKHKDVSYPAQVNKLLADFVELRKTPFWKTAIKGAAYFIQVHVAKSDGLLHPHVHIVAECHTIAAPGRCNGVDSAWVSTWLLSALWYVITGDSDNVHVSRIYDTGKAAREACRYSARPINTKLETDDAALSEIMIALRSRRLCSPLGSWRGMKMTSKPEVDDTEVWLDHGRLVDVVWAARRGEEWANRILDLLWKRTQPERAPPNLYVDSWWGE